MAIKTETGIHAAFEHVIEHKIEGEKFRQVVTDDTRWAAAGEDCRHPALGHLFRNRLIVARGSSNQRDVQPVAFVARASVGDSVERNLDKITHDVPRNNET